MKISNQKSTNKLAINIPADGLFLAILNKANGDLSEENCTRIIKKYIDRHLEANPDIILLNVCYRRSLTPSDVFDSYLYDISTDENGHIVKTLSPVTDNVSKYFSSFFSCARVLLQNEIDIYKILTNHIRESGCKVFLSVRMNDGHYTDNPAINSSFALKNNSMHTIFHDGVALDFSQEAVQNYFYEYIQELLDNYFVDGIELDWLRYPMVLPPELSSDYSILNNYMKNIRNLLDSYDRELSLAVRILPNEQNNMNNGVDACQWVADGTVDMITIENFYIPTNFEMPIAHWKSNIQERNTAQNRYQLFCGSDWGVSCMSGYNIAMTPALVRGFATECLSHGADGIYLFNFFEENDTSSLELTVDSSNVVYLKNCFTERIKAAKEPYSLPRRYVHIGDSNQRYPIILHANSSYKFSYKIKKPFEQCRIIIGLDKDISSSVFVSELHIGIPLQNAEVYTGFDYIPETEIGKDNHFIYSVSQAAPYIKSALLPISLCETPFIDIVVQNNTSQIANILWIELSFE